MNLIAVRHQRETQGPSTSCVGSLRSPMHFAQDDRVFSRCTLVFFPLRPQSSLAGTWVVVREMDKRQRLSPQGGQSYTGDALVL